MTPEREKRKIALLEIRERERVAKEKIKKQESCKHNYVWRGHGHNDDYYECSICGHGVWE